MRLIYFALVVLSPNETRSGYLRILKIFFFMNMYKAIDKCTAVAFSSSKNACHRSRCNAPGN